ncbi:hypothetical protein HaLaN_00138 [Haematococcus lacustris]|uniref:Uncharacterized protein n=1 Tax=Haematococcus lacustris TaxID=44745 RepID=A0A699YI80_HAELA|nr:hypothetical protein HaLaN_00138 [Haematococcus lacustris]
MQPTVAAYMCHGRVCYACRSNASSKCSRSGNSSGSWGRRRDAHQADARAAKSSGCRKQGQLKAKEGLRLQQGPY